MKNNLDDDCYEIQETENLENYTDSILFKNFLANNQEDKKELKLSKEIIKKKYQISSLFNKKFGKHFLNQKPESLKLFEKRLAKYLFDPDSKFLTKFPRLQRKLKHEKKISEELLEAKIDIGSMVFYDLRGKNKRKTRNINIGKEKILSISKNFISNPIKDVVQDTFYKKKFWEKNAQRLKIFFKKRLSIFNDYYIEERDDDKNNIHDNNNLVLENEDNTSIKDLIIKENNTQREKQNLKLNTINNTLSNNSNINTNIKSNTLKNNSIPNSILKKKKYNLKEKNRQGNNKSDFMGIADKIEPSLLDLKINDSNSFAKKELQRKRSSVNYSIENKFENDKFISSYNSDCKKVSEIIPKITPYNSLSRNRNNNSILFNRTNTNSKTNTRVKKNNIYNITNIKVNSKNFGETVSHFNKKNNLKAYNIFKTNTNSNYKYSPKIYPQKNDDALKRRQFKFKNTFNNQIIKLNQYTNKCNTELIKLIDGNNDDNYKERKKKIIKKK